MMSDEIISYAAFESRYRDRFYIGSGGFAKVYKVFDHAKNHYVALKMADVRPEWKQFTLKREVELVNGLPQHRNIARYENCYRFNTGITGQVDFAILKFYEYGNLEQFISRQTTLSMEDRRVIIRGILDGIGFLHDNHIIHRDLKAQNILMHREDGVWTPKITDFGLSRQATGNSTITNSAVGLSYAYAAPEQILNQKIYKNVDLWSVGVIIYRIIAGELPFQSNSGGHSRSTQSQLQISQKIINLELPERLETLEEPYRTIIRKCLVLNPEERVQSARDLTELLAGEEPVHREDSFRPVNPEEDDEEKTLFVHAPAASEGSMPPVQQEKISREEIRYPEPEAPPAYESPTEVVYQTPRDNPTQIITPQNRGTVEPERAPHQLRTADGKDRSLDWLLVIVLLLVILTVAAGFLWWLNSPEQGPGIDWG